MLTDLTSRTLVESENKFRVGLGKKKEISDYSRAFSSSQKHLQSIFGH